MKLLALCLIATAAQAQVVPTTPTKFKSRGLGTTTSSTTSVNGAGGSASVGVAPPKTVPMTRTITYLALSGIRQWTSSDGKPLTAKLIAFEDMVVETPTAETKTGGPTTTMPKLNGKPTLIKDGKVRLLANQKPYEVPLEKLSQADRDYIQTLQQGIDASAAPKQ